MPKQSWQSRVNQEHYKENYVDDGEADKELREGGDDIVVDENDASEDIGENPENTNSS